MELLERLASCAMEECGTEPARVIAASKESHYVVDAGAQLRRPSQLALSGGTGTQSTLAGETMAPDFLCVARLVLTCSDGMLSKLTISSARMDVTSWESIQVESPDAFSPLSIC